MRHPCRYGIRADQVANQPFEAPPIGWTRSNRCIFSDHPQLDGTDHGSQANLHESMVAPAVEEGRIGNARTDCEGDVIATLRCALTAETLLK